MVSNVDMTVIVRLNVDMKSIGEVAAILFSEPQEGESITLDQKTTPEPPVALHAQ
jgi:hypothetical protein